MTIISTNRVVRLGVALIALALAGCNDSDGDVGPQAPLVVAKAAAPNGDQQTGQVSTTLTEPLRVIVTRDGNPAADVTVLWSTPEGAVNPLSGVTGADGIVSTSWRLGPSVGVQSAQATVADATGSPVNFTASAIQPGGPGGPDLQRRASR